MPGGLLFVMLAQASAGPGDWLSQPHPGLPPILGEATSEDSRFWRFTGQAQAVGYWFSQTAANRAVFGEIPDGAAFRRIRFGITGFYDRLDYAVVAEFINPNHPRFVDLFIGVKDLPGINHLRFGHFFEPFSLERTTPNRFVTFIERAAAVQTFSPARNVGLMAFDNFADQRGYWALGVFSSDSEDFGESNVSKYQSAVTGRLTILPVWEGDGAELIHIGAAYSIRNTDNQARFRSQPEAQLGTPSVVPNFVDTGPLVARWYQLFGAEFLAVQGPWSLQAEYIVAPVGVQSSGWQTLHGGYVQASWFVTGEHVNYIRSNATVGRIKPLCSVDECGAGAWEFAARLSYLDLETQAVDGGTMFDVTAAVTWYPTEYLRCTFNYIHSMPSRGGSANIFGIRLGYEF